MPSLLSLPLALLLVVGEKTAQLDLFPAVPPESFSLQIRRLRDRLGLSQRVLAEKIGCRQSHVANVERGRDRFGEWRRGRVHDLMREAA